jgi:hypothetical protein
MSKHSSKTNDPLDSLVTKYLVTSKPQEISETLDQYVDEQDHSNSPSTAVSLVRGKIQSQLDNPPGLAVLGAALVIAAACMMMKDAGKRNGLLTLCKNLIGRV